MSIDKKTTFQLPVRVLCLFTLLNRGGAETMCMNVYRNIDRRRVQFDFLVYYPQRGEYEDEIESLGGRVYRIPHLEPKNIVSHIKGARKFFTEHPEYQIVHNHMGENGGLICCEAKRAGVKTIIFHSHVDLVPLFRLQSSIIVYKGKQIKKRQLSLNTTEVKLRFLYFFAIRSATHYFACGENAAKVFRRHRNQAYIIRNGIDIEKFSFDNEIRKKKRKEMNCEDNFIVGNVGRLNNNKNQDFAIDIMSELIRIQPNAQMWFVGDGIEKDSLLQKTRKLGLHNNIRFLGVRKDVDELLQAMDVFLFTSKKEGLPVSCIEAQAAGLPCVLNNGFDPNTIITNNCSTISLQESPLTWACEIEKYSNFKRNDTSDQIKASGYDIVEVSKWLERFYLKKSY